MTGNPVNIWGYVEISDQLAERVGSKGLHSLVIRSGACRVIRISRVALDCGHFHPQLVADVRHRCKTSLGNLA